jgi:AraC-like DNA-binding protein
MRAGTATIPTVPISYVRHMIDVAAALGADCGELLDGTGIDAATLERADARVSLLQQYAMLCRRAVVLTGEPALAYEFGLRSTLTTHGILGYGLMSQATLRHVLQFADRFAAVLRMPAWNMRFFIDEHCAVMEGRETISHGDLRRFSCETLLVSVSTIARQLLPADAGIELLFEHPEPPYHDRYRERLPACTFSASANQMRIPLRYLDLPLKMADAVSAQIAERECARELDLIGEQRDVVNQLRAILVHQPNGYPSFEAIASRLYMSPRTLTRQLAERGTSFRRLLAEARNRDSRTLLKDPRLSLTDIAQRLDYSSQANFARAFRTWNGVSPGRYRERSIRTR